MTMVVALRSADEARELARVESSGFFTECLALTVDGSPPERSAVRPIVDESATSWPGVLDAAIDAARGAIVGLVSESPAEAAVLACDLASWAGTAGRAVVVVDGSVENPVIDKALNEHGDEGLVDAVLFGVSSSVAARRTLTAGVRVVTAGSHPLALDAVFSPNEFARVVRGFEAETVFLVLPRAYIRLAGRSLDVLVAIARDAEGLEGMAREGIKAEVERGVGVLLCEADVRADMTVPSHEEAAAPAARQEEPAASQLAPIGAAGSERGGTESAEATVRAGDKPSPRRNEFVQAGPAESPFINEPRGRPAEPVGARARHRIRLGFIGWLAISAILIIVALTVFDLTLRPKRLAWRGTATTETGGPPAADVDGVEAGGGGDQAEAARSEVHAEPPGEVGVRDESLVADYDSGADVDAGADRLEVSEPVLIGAGPGEVGGDVFVDGASWIEDGSGTSGRDAALIGSGGPYIILLSSHRLRSAAEWDASRAEARGMPARILEVELPESGAWYRVALAGGHATLASARVALDIVKELGYEGAWLVRDRGNG